MEISGEAAAPPLLSRRLQDAATESGFYQTAEEEIGKREKKGK